jgi:hypothetical protein
MSAKEAESADTTSPYEYTKLERHQT